MRRWRTWVALGVGGLLVGAVALRRNDLAEAWDQTRNLSAAAVVMLLAAAVLGIAAEGGFTQSASPEMTLGQAIRVQQAATAMNNTIVGSGPLSTALRIAMMRSWAVPDLAIGLSIVAMNVAAAFRVWGLGAAAALVGLSLGRDDVVRSTVYVLILGVAAVVIAGSAGLWAVLLTSRRLSGWAAPRAQKLWDRVRRRLRWLPALQLHELADESRAAGRRLVRRRGARIAGTGVASQLAAIVQLVVVVRVFGIGGSALSIAEIFVSYGLIRLAAALTPIPGGLGVTEFGLTALLTDFGGPNTAVLAAVLTYRALTFALPMLVGALVIAQWRQASSALAVSIAATPDLGEARLVERTPE